MCSTICCDVECSMEDVWRVGLRLLAVRLILVKLCKGQNDFKGKDLLMHKKL